MMRVYKETLARRQRDAEFRLERHQKDTMEFNLRRFKRVAVLNLHQLEQKLLREVSQNGVCQATTAACSYLIIIIKRKSACILHTSAW